MTENDYLVPSYLLNVYSKPDGWVEIPETDPDADAEFGNQPVYVIDCEMARTLSYIFSITY